MNEITNLYKNITIKAIITYILLCLYFRHWNRLVLLLYKHIGIIQESIVHDCVFLSCLFATTKKVEIPHFPSLTNGFWINNHAAQIFQLLRRLENSKETSLMLMQLLVVQFRVRRNFYSFP